MAERVISISRDIDAPAGTIFDLLADPTRHIEFDGSETIQKPRGGEQRLTLGSKFGMDMKLGPIPYKISNEVVEFEEDRLIAWQHFGKHRWRYKLEPLGDTRTKVTEEFDWSTSRFPLGIELAGYPKRHPANIERSLERLAAAVESS